jgi:hypothetical protein
LHGAKLLPGAAPNLFKADFSVCKTSLWHKRQNIIQKPIQTLEQKKDERSNGMAFEAEGQNAYLNKYAPTRFFYFMIDNA